jgi:hypothetical protein
MCVFGTFGKLAAPEAAQIADIYTVATPNYRAVMESYKKAQDVAAAAKNR